MGAVAARLRRPRSRVHRTARPRFFYSAKVHCTKGVFRDSYAADAPACIFKPYIIDDEKRSSKEGTAKPYRPEHRALFAAYLAELDALARAQAADNGTKPGSLQWRRRGFLAGNRVATELRARSQSRHKETSQRAWLTDDDDGRLLVDRVVKLEDEAAYATVATEAGLLEELCGAPPCDRGAEAPAWLKAVHHGRRHLYYDDLSCEIVARRFAVDFAEFGYDIDDCYGTRG